MRMTLACLLTVTISLTAMCDDPLPPKIEALLEAAKAPTIERINVLQRELNELEAYRRRNGISLKKDQKAKLVEQIEKKKAEIAAAQGGEIAYPRLDIFEPKIGGIGSIPSFRVSQIIDAKTLHVAPTENGRVIIRGVTTAGLVDRSTFVSDKPFEVVGTESYISVLGAKMTVFVLEPFDTDKWLPIIKKHVAAANAKAPKK